MAVVIHDAQQMGREAATALMSEVRSSANGDYTSYDVELGFVVQAV